MKKFLKEFKEFAMRGNVIDMAVGVIIGAAFGKVVTAVIEIFLNPILEALPKMEGGGTGFAGSILSFLAVVVEFVLTALVLFLIIKAMNKAKDLTKKKAEEAPAAPAPTCPYCLEEIKEGATRCPHCAGDLLAYKKE